MKIIKLTKYIPLSIRGYLYENIGCKIKNYLLFKKRIDYKKIPIIINNYNRLSFLKRLIQSLEIRGYHNIYIIDNNSTYPPLIEYYKKCPYTIFKLNKNVGYKAIWDTNIFERFRHYFYVYTDADMEIDDSCPDDFIKHFLSIMKKHPLCQKVGFGIRIDDLPDYYKHKLEVIQHESQFWKNEVSKDVYRAMIDTTFAIYRPECGGPANIYQETYRTGYPYVIRHLPWYNDSFNLNEEEIFYLKQVKNSTHWSNICQKDINI